MACDYSIRRSRLGAVSVALVACCLLLAGAPAAAQEEAPAPPPEQVDEQPVDENTQRVLDLLNAPYPLADQSEPDWWKRTTVDWRLTPALLQAYQNFWAAREEALATLDARLLESTMGGIALQYDRAAIEELRAKGQVQILQVDHFPEVWEAVADEGVVFDPYVSTTYNADARTKARVDPEYPPTTFEVAYRLQRLDGAWKVVDAIRIVDENTDAP
jgi:hypothetical protein